MNFRKTIITALLIGVCVGVCANTGSENDIFGKSRKKHKKSLMILIIIWVIFDDFNKVLMM